MAAKKKAAAKKERAPVMKGVKISKDGAVVRTGGDAHVESQVPQTGAGNNPAIIRLLRDAAAAEPPPNYWLERWKDVADLVLPRLTRRERIVAWIKRNNRWIAACVVAFATGWILSTVYSGLTVADACETTAAFELWGRVYVCGLGK